IADPGQPILTPAISARARVVMWEVGPCRPVGAVVLAYRTPSALAQVWPPVAPGGALSLQSLVLVHFLFLKDNGAKALVLQRDFTSEWGFGGQRPPKTLFGGGARAAMPPSHPHRGRNLEGLALQTSQLSL